MAWLKFSVLLLLTFCVGWLCGFTNRPPLNVRAYGSTVVDQGDPFPETRIVCHNPIIDQQRRLIICTPRGE